MSSHSLASEREKYDVKPQDIGGHCRVIPMPIKWAKRSFVVLNESMQAVSVNYSQSYPQKRWSEASSML